MAHPKLRPAKPVDQVAYEPVMVELSRARALVFVLSELGDAKSELSDDLRVGPQDTRDWLHDTVTNALISCHDAIERHYRALNTNLFEKEAATLAATGGA